MFGEGPQTLIERRVRRVGRWLRRMRLETVSREEVRREALGQTVDADTAESVLDRLEQYGAVRMLPAVKEARRGPRKLRWQTEEFPRRERTRDAHTVYLRPELVVEIELDGVQVSPRYPGGVALRFARVLRYRPDKDAADADTIDAVRALLPSR